MSEKLKFHPVTKGGLCTVWLGIALISCLSLGLGIVWSDDWSTRNVLPAGSALTVQLLHPITSETATLGEKIAGRVVSVSVLKGNGDIRPGTRVELRCVAVSKGEGAAHPGYLRLVLSGFKDREGHFLAVQTTTFSLMGNGEVTPSSTKFANLRHAALKMGAELSAGPGGNKAEVVVKPDVSLTFVLLKPAVVSDLR